MTPYNKIPTPQEIPKPPATTEELSKAEIYHLELVQGYLLEGVTTFIVHGPLSLRVIDIIRGSDWNVASTRPTLDSDQVVITLKPATVYRQKL